METLGAITIYSVVTLGILVVFAVSVVAAAVVRGFVLSNIWNWLLVPMFGFSPLNIPMAIAVSFIVGYLVHPGVMAKDLDNQSVISTKAQVQATVVNLVLAPAFTLLFAYILKSILGY